MSRHEEEGHGLMTDRPVESTMHQLGNGMYVSGLLPPPPDSRKKERQMASAATPYTGGDPTRSGELGRMFNIVCPSRPASSRRSAAAAGPRPSALLSAPLSSSSLQLPCTGLLVGPWPPSTKKNQRVSTRGAAQAASVESGCSRRSTAHAASVESGCSRRSTAHAASVESGCSRRSTAQAAGAAVARGEARLGVAGAWYAVLAVAAAAALGAGAFCLVSLRRWEPLAAAGAAVAAVALLLAWNACRRDAEAERFLLRAAFSRYGPGDDLPVGELVKITGVTCSRQPLGAYFNDAARRCVFTSVQLFERRGWARRWRLRHSEERVTNFYISDRSSGRRFYVRAAEEGAKLTPIVKRRTISFDGDGANIVALKKMMRGNKDLSCDGDVRVKEGFIREGDSASVIGILKKEPAGDFAVDAPTGAISTGCKPKRFMFPVLVEGLVLIGAEDPDEVVYLV